MGATGVHSSKLGQPHLHVSQNQKPRLHFREDTGKGRHSLHSLFSKFVSYIPFSPPPPRPRPLGTVGVPDITIHTFAPSVDPPGMNTDGCHPTITAPKKVFPLL